MAYDNLIVERKGAVGIVTINRPKALNALSRATVAELDQAIIELDADDSIRTIILTGGGGKAFVAGADIGEFNTLESAQAAVEYTRSGQAVLNRIEHLPKPVVAVINGYALGGGCELAMACDIRIASESARLGQPEINLGIIPGYGGTQRLPRLVGKGAAKLLALGGDPITAQEALRIGLVDMVVPATDLMQKAMELAEKLASKPPVALRLIKQSINEGSEGTLVEGLHHEAALFGLVFDTEDRVEGVNAFLQKRKPVWKGK